MKPLLAVTMGDPAGIGPEICLRLLRDRTIRKVLSPVVIGSARILAKTAVRAGIPFEERGDVMDIRLSPASRIRPGKPNAASGKAAYGYIRTAVSLTREGIFSGVVTAPISKEALKLAGLSFPGHTEMLASLCGVRDSTLMLWSPRLVVTFVTLHMSLARVSGALSKRGIETAIFRTAGLLNNLGHRKPRIGVLGLNPHSGEKGIFGDEERRKVEPAIKAARRRGMDVSGPLVPDVAFTRAKLGDYDAFVALYHDQGGIPFKMLSFEDGVNVTLGLPIVRTSVDHGTACDIVGKGLASASSLLAACRLAARLVQAGPPSKA